ncbi:MAG: transcriptional regulator [Clostridia bacterium]|nr:transcriptional regulator [Clostridia bacterium]
MAARQGSKLKILYIVDILRKYSDEQNPITATEICEHLAKLGVTAERKAIYDDIENLIFYGFDIIKTRGSKSGYFMASRELEMPEIYLLTDAVQAADFITPKKTRELVNKLDDMLSDKQAKKREKSVYIEKRHKCDNEEIYLSIDTLRQAIEERKKATLRYGTRKLRDDRKIILEEKEFTVSPYALVWVDDHYYLICNNEKYDNLLHLRLDRMKKVTKTEEKFRHFSEVSEYTDNFHIADYISKTFNMFGGELTEIELSCDVKLLEQVIDRFSDKIHIIKLEEGKFNFRVNALISDGLVSWITQFDRGIEVISPLKLRDMIVKKAENMLLVYKK